jgi:hypothetical protein
MRRFFKKRLRASVRPCRQCPGRGKAVNDAAEAAFIAGQPAKAAASAGTAVRRSEISAPKGSNRGQNVAFTRILQGGTHHYDRGQAGISGPPV